LCSRKEHNKAHAAWQKTIIYATIN
jgi:hypothetical protein